MEIRDDNGIVELMAATCVDGIGVIANWRRLQSGGWAVTALDTENAEWEEIKSEEEEPVPIEPVPIRPPTHFDDR